MRPAELAINTNQSTKIYPKNDVSTPFRKQWDFLSVSSTTAIYSTVQTLGTQLFLTRGMGILQQNEFRVLYMELCVLVML